MAIRSKTSITNFKSQVWQIVKRIPAGEVATYGEIATRAGKPKWWRQVGWVLHQNRDLKVPCHRVVNRNGRLAPNFAFGGWRGQRRRLLTEGVRFRDNMHVDLEQCKFTLGFTGKSREFSSGPVPRTKPIV